MKTAAAVALTVLIGFRVSLAQDGSPLSSRGVGAFTSFAGSRSSGMGNAGLALYGPDYLNRLNPATWSSLRDVQFTGSFGFSGVSSTDDVVGESSYYGNGDFQGGIFAIPIDHGLGISMAAGFTPLTSYQFEISAPVDSTASIPSATYQRTGSGGLGEAFFGATVSPAKWLNLGGMFQYAFGRTQSTGLITYSNSSYQNTYLDNSLYLRGPGGTFGVVVDDIDGLTGLKSLEGLSFGGYYKFAYDLVGTSGRRSLYSDGLDTTFVSSGAGYIPPEFGIGMSKKFGDKLTAVIDARAQQLSRYHDTFTPAGSLGDALFIGGGVQYVEGSTFASLFQKRVLRAGLYYQKTQFMVKTKSGREKQLDELFATAGIEFPISVTAALDIGAQYGFRGLSSDYLLHESIFRLYLSVTMGEIWFNTRTGD